MMKELSLNVLDVVRNSVAAGAGIVEISLVQDAEGILQLCIRDDGCGMDAKALSSVANPFYTTGTMRRVGLGVPFLKQAAEMTGGALVVSSQTTQTDHGTTLTATFYTESIDMPPVGDMVSTICAIVGGNPEMRLVFRHEEPGRRVFFDTAELRAVLGEEIPLSTYEVIDWIRDYLTQQYQSEK